MNANKRTNVKMLAAVIGGSAVVAMGALTMAINHDEATPATVTSSGMTVGATTTQDTPPATPATPFGGAGS